MSGNPNWDEFQRMQDEMDAMFGHLWWMENNPRSPLLTDKQTPSGQLVPRGFRTPLTDIYETDNEIVSTTELPGVSKEDIKLRLLDSAVEISVEKKAEKKEEDKKKGFIRMERSYLGFYRALPLPENADADNLSATYKEGILELRIPKRHQEEPKARDIKMN